MLTRSYITNNLMSTTFTIIMRLILFVLSAFIIISCSDSGTNPVEESVWQVTGDSTAVWTGSDISARGKYDYVFREDKVDITLNTYPSRARVAISVTYNDEYREEVSINEGLQMYSTPAETQLMSWKKRVLECSGNACEETFTMSSFPLGGVGTSGEVSCSDNPTSVPFISIIYEDSQILFIEVEFESAGVEDTIKQLACN